MERILFTDGDQIGVTDGETTKRYDSEYITRYRDYSQNKAKNDEWKYTGEGARFRGDYDVYRTRAETVDAYINGVQWDGDKVLYSFTVNNSSGVYRKDITNEKSREEHILSLNEEEILSIYKNGNLLAVTVKKGGLSSVGTLDTVTSELKTYTEGDALDCNPSFSTTDGNVIFFDSAGVGRTANGEFTGKFAPASIYSLNTDTLEMQEIVKDNKNSFVKPKQDKDGALWCIQRPNKEKRENPVVEILLIPVRIVLAVVMFLQAFVRLFTGKNLVSQGEGTKTKKTSERKLYIDGKMIEAEKELKRNKKFKDKEYGFIPQSWKLVKIKDGQVEEVQSGVCDFTFGKEGVYYTNGKHIFKLSNGKREKVCDTDMCLCVAAESLAAKTSDLFSI